MSYCPLEMVSFFIIYQTDICLNEESIQQHLTFCFMHFVKVFLSLIYPGSLGFSFVDLLNFSMYN
ncbi:hypothetical protein Hanom_Chr04g00370121 [Helianthus anomalus]